MKNVRLPILLLIIICVTAITEKVRASEQTEENKVYRLDIVVNAPASFLFPYLIEEDKVSRWNQDDSVEVTFPRGLEPCIGKQIHVRLKVPTHPWILMEIVKLDAPREVVTQFIDGVLEGTFAYRLEPQGENRTLLVHEMSIRPVGIAVTVIWELFGKRLHREKMRNFLQKIKQVVEEDYQRQLVELTPVNNL